MLDENIEKLSEESGENKKPLKETKKDEKAEETVKETEKSTVEPVEKPKAEEVEGKVADGNTDNEEAEVHEDAAAVKSTEEDEKRSEDDVKEGKEDSEEPKEPEGKEEDVAEKESDKEVKEEEAGEDQKEEQKETEEVKGTEAENVKEKAKEEDGISREKKTEKSAREITAMDYTKLSIDELAEEFENLIQNFSVKDIRNQFEEIKTTFNKKYNNLVKEKKEEFIKQGGNEIDFTFITPVRSKFFDLIKEFKRRRKQYYKQIETEQQENLEKKLILIERLKGLIDTAEPASMYKEFKELQTEWRNVGQIPRAKYNDIWQTYHHHVERFYDLLHLNKEFRDLDFKHNLEEKSKLVEKAEKLAAMQDVDKAFRELQVLHRMWKEDIGPVAREHRDEIWDRFSAATKLIHHKRHELQKNLEAKFEENIDKKLAVIEKIKSLDLDSITSHKGWQNTIHKVESLREEFFAIGRVPSAKNEEIWQLFKDATRNFNRAKNSFYKSIKSEQLENLTKKMHLIEQAESLKDSEDWETVTEIFKKIQSDWKKIGHVPKKDSDKIWKRFKDACNHYFDRLHDRQDDSNKEQVEAFNKKKELLVAFKEKFGGDEEFTLDEVNDFIEVWRGLGSLPQKMGHIEAKFNKSLEMAYKKLDIDKDEVSFLKFKNIVDSYLSQNDHRKLDNEQLFIRKKIDELTKEIKQLENNVSFISNVSEDNPLVQNVMNNIANYKKDLDIWKRKIGYLRKLDY